MVRVVDQQHLQVQAGVQPQNLETAVEQGICRGSILNEAVKAHQLGAEEVAAAADHDLLKFRCEILAGQVHQVKEQGFLIRKVLVETASGNAGPPDDLVDGRVGKADGGELLPGRCQKAVPLFLR